MRTVWSAFEVPAGKEIHLLTLWRSEFELMLIQILIMGRALCGGLGRDHLCSEKTEG